MDESQQCLRCGRSAAWSEGTCIACGSTLLVDLWLLVVPPDPRVRYALARQLAALPGLNVDVAAQLKTPRPLLAHRVTRALAGSVAAALVAGNLEFEILPLAAETASPPSGLSKPLLALVVVALAGIGIAGRVLWKTLTSDKLETPTTVLQALTPSLPSLPHRDAEPVSLKDAVQSVVSVRCSHSTGSGFFVGPHTLVTNHHVLCAGGEQPRIVNPAGKEATTIVVARDAKHDLALLTSDLEGKPLEMADAANADVGSQVGIIGSPHGLDFTVHRGNLSFVGRATGGVGYLQIDSAINPGNSGGPVLDAKGRVIGVVTARMVDTEGIGFAVPINYLVNDDPPLWQDGPRAQLLSDEWKAFDAKTRTSAGPALASPHDAANAKLPPKFDALLAEARWHHSKERLQGAPEVEVVVVTTDEQPEDRRWLLELKYRDERICDLLRTRTIAWLRLESTDPNLPAQLKQKLVEHHMDKKLYVGVMAMQWSSCPAAYSHAAVELSLELPKAPPGYNRVGILMR